MNHQNMINQLRQKSAEFDHLWQSYQNMQKMPVVGVPRVVVCGMYNAGKSTLLNALTGHFKDELFKTSVVRETATIQTYKMNDRMYYDTPGIDGQVGDDYTAWNAIINADIFIYAHNSMESEFSSQERVFLHKLLLERPDFTEHHILVITQIDSIQDDAEKAHRINAIQREFSSLIKQEACHVAVSATCYKKGIMANKPALQAFSGFNALQEIVTACCQKQTAKAWQDQRLARLQHKNEQVLACVDQVIASNQMRLRQIQEQQLQSVVRLKALLGNVVEQVFLHQKKINKWERKLDNF